MDEEDAEEDKGGEAFQYWTVRNTFSRQIAFIGVWRCFSGDVGWLKSNFGLICFEPLFKGFSYSPDLDGFCGFPSLFSNVTFTTSVNFQWKVRRKCAFKPSAFKSLAFTHSYSRFYVCFMWVQNAQHLTTRLKLNQLTNQGLLFFSFTNFPTVWKFIMKEIWIIPLLKKKKPGARFTSFVLLWHFTANVFQLWVHALVWGSDSTVWRPCAKDARTCVQHFLEPASIAWCVHNMKSFDFVRTAQFPSAIAQML